MTGEQANQARKQSTVRRGFQIGAVAFQIAVVISFATLLAACPSNSLLQDIQTLKASDTNTIGSGATYTLTVQSGGNGSVAINGGTSTTGSTAIHVGSGTSVSLAATPSSGYGFTDWTIVSGSPSIANTTSSLTTVTLSSGDATIQANFAVTTYPWISYSPTSFTFSGVPGGANPANQTLGITNSGTGSLNWSVASDQTWLKLSPTSGTSPSGGSPENVTVSVVNVSTMTSGTYTANITITGTGASNSPVIVPVTLTLTALPAIGFSPTSLSFAADAGGSNPANKTLDIYNSGGGTLSWTASSNQSWLKLSTTSGSSTGTSDQNAVTVSVSTTGMSGGTYGATITLSASGASNTPQSVPVSLTLNSFSISGTITLATSSGTSYVSGVTVSAGTATATTGSNGNYTISGLSDGSYVVRPSGAGYSYWPMSQSASVSGADVSSEDFHVPTVGFFAGQSTASYSGDGGPATSAQLSGPPMGLTVDSSGNVYISDTGNNVVREVAAATGTIETIIGNGARGFSGDNGPATGAELDYPTGLAVFTYGDYTDVYVVDTGNNRVREAQNPMNGGYIYTDVGAGTYFMTPTYNGLSGSQLELSSPQGVAVIMKGGNPDFYMTDFNDPYDVFFSTQFGDQISVAAASASLSDAQGVAVDSAGNLYIADTNNCRVLKMDTSGTLTTFAGNGTCGYSGDGGKATSAELNGPDAIAVDSSGNVYIGEIQNEDVREVDTQGVITTLAGRGGSYPGSGVAAAQLNFKDPVYALAYGNGTLYASFPNAVLKIQ